LLLGTGADDRDHEAGLLSHPVERNLRGRAACLFGDGHHLARERLLCLARLARVAAGPAVFGEVLPRQRAAFEGAPGADGQVELAGHGQKVALGAAVGEAQG
jgi:hypothetical protein